MINKGTPIYARVKHELDVGVAVGDADARRGESDGR
jgi:hypothetical protein